MISAQLLLAEEFGRAHPCLFLKRALTAPCENLPYRLGTIGELIMPGFEIAWNRRRLVRRQHGKGAPLVQDAILLERVLLGDRQHLKIVCCVASVIENRQSDPAARDRFWSSARTRLGKVHRLSQGDLDEIESVLANMVPKPMTHAAE
jgi:hypothetical protein